MNVMITCPPVKQPSRPVSYAHNGSSRRDSMTNMAPEKSAMP